MNVAAGFKAHSGWAAVVVVGSSPEGLRVVERRRVELVDPENLDWAKQPYHAAEGLEPAEARERIRRGTEAAHAVAAREIRGLIDSLHEGGHALAGCAVLTGGPMPDWTTDQILAVHVRMHQAEGALFPDALAHAVVAAGASLALLPEKELAARAEKTLKTSPSLLRRRIATLGKSVGPPWGADQKNAALAALVVLGRDGLRIAEGP